MSPQPPVDIYQLSASQLVPIAQAHSGLCHGFTFSDLFTMLCARDPSVSF